MNSTFSTASSLRRLGWGSFVSICVVGGLCALMLGILWIRSKQAVFFTTASPHNTFSVKLKGDKGRPLIIPNEVRADVLKFGQPYMSDIWLHSTGDSFDLSFESGFPNVRWLNDNTVEFYRPEDFEKGMDSLLISNRADRTIKYLRVQSENKFLLFELPSGTSVSLNVPAPRGDSQWIGLEGAFSDAKEIPFNSKSFNRRSTQRKHSFYEISIDESGSNIEAKD
jgi:hypothetical protein